MKDQLEKGRVVEIFKSFHLRILFVLFISVTPQMLIRNTALADDQASRMDYDSRRIFGLANNPTETEQYATVKDEIKRANENLAKNEKALKTVQAKLAQDQQDLEKKNILPVDLEDIKMRVKTLKVEEEKLQKGVTDAKKALEVYPKDERIRKILLAGDAALLKTEVARKGLQIKVTDLGNRLDRYGDTLDAIEEELNNTVLEAFVVAKLARFAAAFCDAKKTCDSNSLQARDDLMKSVTSADLFRDATKAKSESAGTTK